MPISPHKGESQSDFMTRCVPEMIGTGDDKRPQDQAVAACLQIWRDSKKELAGPIGPTGPKGDRISQFADATNNRYPIDTVQEIGASWVRLHKPKNASKYQSLTELAGIKAKVVAAWKLKIDPSGPPRASDKIAMAALAKEVRAYADIPDPDDGESHDDYIERCVDEVSDDMDEDDAEEACQLNWDENNGDDERAPPSIMHKQHVSPVDSGMEFILSDATPDRYGDIVEPKGWEISAFLRNPVALFAHDKTFIVGTWQGLKTGDVDLRGQLKLAPLGTSPRIDEIRRLVEAGILKATSVGFRPLKADPINPKDPFGGGTRYLQHELVETSLVAIPANPNALAVAKSLNISDDTMRTVFREHASKAIVHKDHSDASARGEHADKQRKEVTQSTGEHAKANSNQTGKPMLLSKRIEEAQKNVLAMQDQLEKHLESIDDAAPTEEQMILTEDLSAKIESATRNVNNMKAIEKQNGSVATDAADAGRSNGGGGSAVKMPAGLQLRTKKIEPLDYLFRAAYVTCASKSTGQSIDDMRQKVYGNDEATRVVCDYTLKAASAPALTTVAGWAAELVQQIYADFMQALLPASVFPKLSAAGLALTFGQAGRIIIPTRNLTPSISGSFVGEGQAIPVRQGAFASQTLTPKKLAVITSWTREMGDHSTPAIEGLLRQAVLEDTAISLDAILLDNNAATTIRPPGLRSYQATLTASAVAGNPFANFVADYTSLYGSLLTLTNGNVRSPTLIMNPRQALGLDMIQPPAAAAPLFPFVAMTAGGKVLKASVIESGTVTPGMVIMVDAADFTTAGAEGPRLEISDQATLHFEDTAPTDITGGTPSPATPVKSLWQTDSIALRMVLRMNWIMRRPVVAWMTGVQWG